MSGVKRIKKYNDLVYEYEVDPKCPATEWWFRIDIDYHGRTGHDLGIIVKKYPVKRNTKCGVWLSLGDGKEKFAMRNSFKKWAAPTFEEALESFDSRKRKQIDYLNRNLDAVKYIRNVIKPMLRS